ncbi:hypothetical protein E6R18_25165 [Streptomyces sp. A1277]|uniref:hypothetical protein n=1 Tax=Streptomyces sp. A1277 TaxID=2563103 RepID=UPI0010A25636|nr:hypothetical protein [Streptomyces sp. A1277]THA29204.1 hypothetical protein E6R18_25165 [Streptomyces sp. A1277]
MNATEFRNQHGDPTTWTTTDHETYDVLRRNEQHLAHPNPERDFARCSQRWASGTNYRRHEKAKASADRLRQLLAHAA